MRAFIAIDLPERTETALTRLLTGLKAGRPSAPDTLHLTLAFLGEQTDARLEEAHHALDRLNAPRFDLRLNGLDVFGGQDPRVLFIGAEPNPALEGLHKQVRSALRSAGIELPRERFRPHVTLARFRPGLPPQDLEHLRRFLSLHGNFALPPFPVTGFTLYQSHLRPEGPIHEVLAQYPLR